MVDAKHFPHAIDRSFFCGDDRGGVQYQLGNRKDYISLGDIDNYAVDVAHFTGELAACMEQASGRRDVCSPIARSLQSTVQKNSRRRISARYVEKFEVFLFDKALLLFRKTCVDDDLKIKTFAWGGGTPGNPERLPETRKVHGDFTGAVEFSEQGYRIDCSCLLVIPLPDRPMKSYVGQRDRGRNYWDWKLSR